MSKLVRPLWHATHQSVIGAGHVATGLPCQDASLARIGERPCLVVCDGRGSAKHSDAGAKAAVFRFAELSEDAIPILARALDATDADEVEASRAWAHFAQLAYASLGNVTRRLAEQYPETRPEDFDFTLVAAVTGSQRLGWLHVGDGFIAIERNGALETLSSSDNGEFANQTHFVRPRGEGIRHLRHGIASLNGITGIAAVSDGCEPLLFDTRTGRPAGAFSQIFSAVRSNPECGDTADLLNLPEWSDRTRDDRSIALLTRVSGEFRGVTPHDNPEVATLPTTAAITPTEVAGRTGEGIPATPEFTSGPGEESTKAGTIQRSNEARHSGSSGKLHRDSGYKRDALLAAAFLSVFVLGLFLGTLVNESTDSLSPSLPEPVEARPPEGEVPGSSVEEPSSVIRNEINGPTTPDRDV